MSPADEELGAQLFYVPLAATPLYKPGCMHAVSRVLRLRHRCQHLSPAADVFVGGHDGVGGGGWRRAGVVVGAARGGRVKLTTVGV